jgi:hypothetical protein
VLIYSYESFKSVKESNTHIMYIEWSNPSAKKKISSMPDVRVKIWLIQIKSVVVLENFLSCLILLSNFWPEFIF